MLKNLLTPQDCAKCKFCCSFKKRSLKELYVLTPAEMENLRKKYPEVQFKYVNRNNCAGYVVDMENNYKTNFDDEEIACPFNKNGCILGADKPFECAVWPFRAMKFSDKMIVAFCKDCPIFAKKNLEEIELILESGLGEKILNYAQKFPASIKNYEENYHIFAKFFVNLPQNDLREEIFNC